MDWRLRLASWSDYNWGWGHIQAFGLVEKLVRVASTDNIQPDHEPEFTKKLLDKSPSDFIYILGWKGVRLYILLQDICTSEKG